jgi:hypothetical protein
MSSGFIAGTKGQLIHDFVLNEYEGRSPIYDGRFWDEVKENQDMMERDPYASANVTLSRLKDNPSNISNELRDALTFSSSGWFAIA